MLKVAVVGCGVITQVHIPIITNHKDAELVAVCDTNLEVVKQVTSKFECSGYTDYKEMLEVEDIDVIHICTPHYLHKEMMINAAKAGINVLCEKPLVMNLNEAFEVESVLENLDVKVGIVFQNRHNETNKMMKEYVDKKHLGNLVGLKAFLTWYRPEEYYTKSDWRGTYIHEGGGVLINQSIHTLDLMQWLAGPLEWVSGSYNTRVYEDIIEVEDTAEATMSFKNGCRGVFYATNGYVDNSPLFLELLFEKGRLQLVDNVLTCITEDKRDVVAKENIGKDIRSYYGISHGVLIDKFYNAIINDTNDYIDFKEGIPALKIIEGIRTSQEYDNKFILREGK